MTKQKIFYLSLPLIILVLLAIFPVFWTYLDLKAAPYTGRVYALRLEDQSFVYGKIKSVGAKWIKLSDVYYFQTLTVNESETKNLVPQSSNILTVPENFLLINRSKVLSIEKVGQNSKLIEVMNQNKK